MSGLDNVQTGFESVFSMLPWVMAFCVLMMLVIKFAGPLANDRLEERDKARNKVEAERLRKETARAEIVLRGEFDDWLDAEVLRLQIECAADPGNTLLVKALTAVTQARTSNSTRITELHQGKGKNPTVEDAESVNQQWQALRGRDAAGQANPA